MRLVFGLSVLLVATSCTRPVDRPAVGSTFITDVAISPEFVKDMVPIEISFQLIGSTPSKVVYEIGGQEFPCTPEDAGNGRLRCSHPGVSRDEVQQGQGIVVVRATDDDNKTSIAATEVVFDFDCPRFVALEIDRNIAEPGDAITLRIEASEPLASDPIVTRLGRDWSPVEGEGSSFTVQRMITVEDPSDPSMILIRIRDRAGNTSTDCALDGEVPFAVDHTPPTVDARGVVLTRDAPGAPARVVAAPGTFSDDVGVDHVRVLDETGTVLVATLSAEADGSIGDTNLSGSTSSRVQLEVVDRFGRTSERLTIRERWRVSVGTGVTPGAAIRTAVRYTPAPPVTTSMRSRTFELAPDVAAADARTAIVRGTVGFRKVGDLPSRYEGTSLPMIAYDEVGKTVVAIGGYDGRTFRIWNEWVDETLLISWDEREGQYLTEQGPQLSFDDPSVPAPRYGEPFAFNGQGCGIIIGGHARFEQFNDRVIGDVWQICNGPGGYTWERINVTPPVANFAKYAPIVWDPINSRYVMIGGGEGSGTRVLFIEPGTDADSWTMTALNPLPTTFNGRSSHALWFDPRTEAIVTGLGAVFPIGSGEQNILWSYQRGQWLTSLIPNYQTFILDSAFAFDEARLRLVMWGGSDDPSRFNPRESVYYFTGSSTSGPEAWSIADLDTPIPRDVATMVYDSDREVVVMFGGFRVNDSARVPPEIHELISEPSFPYLQANADLAAGRPKGIETLHLTIRASGIGDADRLGPRRDRGFGVRVLLWDHDARGWVEVRASTGGAQGIETLEVDVTDNPGRYVSEDGRVPITLSPVYPSTEMLDGRLEVDQIDGYLDLRAGIALP